MQFDIKKPKSLDHAEVKLEKKIIVHTEVVIYILQTCTTSG